VNVFKNIEKKQIPTIAAAAATKKTTMMKIQKIK